MTPAPVASPAAPVGPTSPTTGAVPPLIESLPAGTGSSSVTPHIASCSATSPMHDVDPLTDAMLRRVRAQIWDAQGDMEAVGDRVADLCFTAKTSLAKREAAASLRFHLSRLALGHESAVLAVEAARHDGALLREVEDAKGEEVERMRAEIAALRESVVVERAARERRVKLNALAKVIRKVQRRGVSAKIIAGEKAKLEALRQRKAEVNKKKQAMQMEFGLFLQCAADVEELGENIAAVVGADPVEETVVNKGVSGFGATQGSGPGSQGGLSSGSNWHYNAGARRGQCR